MNTVEKIKAELKAQKIPVSRMERDLGFSNGYLGQLKKGTMPVGRLQAVAEYLGKPLMHFLPDGAVKRVVDMTEEERKQLEEQQRRIEESRKDAELSETEIEIRERIRSSYAYRVLLDTAGGAAESDLLEAAALIQKRKEERGL